MSQLEVEVQLLLEELSIVGFGTIDGGPERVALGPKDGGPGAAPIGGATADPPEADGPATEEPPTVAFAPWDGTDIVRPGELAPELAPEGVVPRAAEAVQGLPWAPGDAGAAIAPIEASVAEPSTIIDTTSVSHTALLRGGTGLTVTPSRCCRDEGHPEPG